MTFYESATLIVVTSSGIADDVDFALERSQGQGDAVPIPVPVAWLAVLASIVLGLGWRLYT